MLPVLSALLLVLSFHPFDFWPLVFVALLPLFYFVAAFPERPWREVFWGGFTTGSLFALSLAYFTVIQFHWLPGTHLFVSLVQLSFLPLSVVGGLLCAASLLVYRQLRGGSAVYNVLINAAAYTAGEMALYALCGGYYFAMLSYAVTPLVPLLLFASVGGAFSVSFLVALVNAFVAGYLAYPAERRVLSRAWTLTVAILALAWAAISFGGAPGPLLQTLRVATIQDSARGSVGFGSEQGGVFAFPALEAKIRAAAEGTPELLIYPFSPVEGALYTGAKPSLNKNILAAERSSFVEWAKLLLPASTTLMVWTTLYRDAKFYNVFEFVQRGELVSEYLKRSAFPFLDYTPQWAQHIGLYSTQVDMAEGEGDQPIMLGSVRAGGLLCSEVQRQDLASAESGRSSIIISAGSEAVFVDDVASRYSLKAAQYRAAETGLPIIRANLLGPSGIIDRYGALVAYQARGQEGVLRAELPIFAPRATLYSQWGNMPMALLLAAIFGWGLWRRRKVAYTDVR